MERGLKLERTFVLVGHTRYPTGTDDPTKRGLKPMPTDHRAEISPFRGTDYPIERGLKPREMRDEPMDVVDNLGRDDLTKGGLKRQTPYVMTEQGLISSKETTRLKGD